MAFRDGKDTCTLCDQGTTPAAFPLDCQADCPAAVAVDDLVYVSGPEVLGVVQVDTCDPSDRTTMPCIGIVVSKSTATRCVIRKLGLFSPGAALTPGKPYFVGTSGTLSSSPPPRTGSGTETLVQIVGYALKSNELLFNPGDLSMLILQN